MSDTVEKSLTLNNVHYDVREIPDVKYYNNIEGLLKDKASPKDLANDINSSGNVGATIYIIDKDSYEILFASNLFYLVGFDFALKERAQVINSLTEPILSFFDDSVRVYSLRAVSVDAGSTESGVTYKNFKHSSLIHLYNNHLRGTSLVKNNQIAVLRVANHTIYGYPLNLNTAYESSQDKVASFTMNWAVAKHTLNSPGTVTNRNLENMTNIINQKSINLFLGYLSKYLELFKIAITTDDTYFVTNYYMADITSMFKNTVDMYDSLIAYDVLESDIDFSKELNKSIGNLKTAKDSGSLTKYRTELSNSYSILTTFLSTNQGKL